MNAVLSQALDAVLRERGSRFREAFERAKNLLVAYGQEGIADRIAAEAALQASPLVVADLLSILFWSSTDNGASIRRTSEGWLEECNDEWKVQVALHLEAYPFVEVERMRGSLAKVAAKFPALRARCEELRTLREQDERGA
ncbi:MAG: hypothetical protein KF892_23555 [Rhizobacter sp.]|nr:hypothetical protein [Rhizobacter sp.]